MKTAMNKPLSQGATATGRPARSEEQALLWALTFMVREAVLVAPDNMEKKEAMYYFNGVYEHLKSVWVRIRDALSDITEGVPYILSSFAYLRVPQDRHVSGCWKKEDFLQAFYLSPAYMDFYDRRPTFCDDLEWPKSVDVHPFWCKLVIDLNAARAIQDQPPLVLCLESPLFNTHPRFPLFSTLFQSQYQPLTASTSGKSKRPRTFTEDEDDAGPASRVTRTNVPSGSASKTSATAVKSSGSIVPTKPKSKRLRRDLETEDVEMVDVASGSSRPSAIPQPSGDRKGKGREVVPPEDHQPDPQETSDLSRFANQDVMFEAALKEQLSPIPCESCAQGGHDCFVALRHFHGCWRCKVGSNGCSLVPKNGIDAKKKLKNLKVPANWPWYITLVYHVLNVLALDTNKGPHQLPPDYIDVDIPLFPSSEKVLSVVKPLTTKEVQTIGHEKKLLKAPVNYALPRLLSKAVESRRSESPKWPLLPKDARARFENILRQAENGSLHRPWMAQPSEDVPERGRSRSRAPATATGEKVRSQPRPRTRASSRPSGKTQLPSEPVDLDHPTSVPPTAPSSSKAKALSRATSTPRVVKLAKSKPRSTSRKPKKTPVEKPEVPRAVRGKSIKVNRKEVTDEDKSSSVKRAFVGKRPPRTMKRVPSNTDEDEGMYVAFEQLVSSSNLLQVTLKAVDDMAVEGAEVFLTEPTSLVENTQAPGPSGLLSGQVEDLQSHNTPVNMELLSAALLAQRQEILEDITDALSGERGEINSQIQSGLYKLTETSLTALADGWLRAAENSTKVVFEGMAAGVTDIVDKKLSSFLQNVEAHIDEKIDRSINDLKDFVQAALDSKLTARLINIKQSPEEESDSDEVDDDQESVTEVAAEPEVVSEPLAQSEEMLESSDGDGHELEVSRSDGEEESSSPLQVRAGMHFIVDNYASSSEDSTDLPVPMLTTESGVTDDPGVTTDEREPDGGSFTLERRDENPVADQQQPDEAIAETDADDGDSETDGPSGMELDADADGDADTEEDELEEGEIGQSDEEVGKDEDAMVED
ncbi:hypothetical protein QCA50_014755 [Cerrena zonata]|uniref:Uncharacterized protein n=1 Tax=Cerrena zonata TaxID=2478898 RepID=A0AAW0FMB8_9APHY